MSPKFIVYCGQELDDERDVPDNVPGYCWAMFPERDGGANYVRGVVREQIRTNTPTVFVTRYEHVVSELASQVADGNVSRDDVLFVLVRDDENDNVMKTEHKMSADNQYIGDNWPMGILW